MIRLADSGSARIQWFACALFLMLVIWVSLWGYPGFNQQIFVYLNRAGSSGDWFWQNLTILGEGLVAFVLLACFARRDGDFIWILLLAALIAGISSQLLKHLLEMPRPAAVLEPGSFNLIGAELRSRAFPSGHATTAMVAASLGAWRFPKLTVPLYVIFGMVAASRVVVGAHWPLDVVAGCCLGYLAGHAAARVVNIRVNNSVRKWSAISAWLLQLVLGLWLTVFPLDYPAGRLLVIVISSAAVVTAIIRLRSLLRQ